jgi:hypothetical protein
MYKPLFISMILLIVALATLIGYQNAKINILEGQSNIEVLVNGDIEKEQLRNRCDSLYDELFIRHVENGRYEATFEHLKEVNPKLAKEMEDWMAHETE